MKITRIKVLRTEDNKNFFGFNCTGYGFVNHSELLNSKSKFIDVQCEDDYMGARAYLIDKTDIEKDSHGNFKEY